MALQLLAHDARMRTVIMEGPRLRLFRKRRLARAVTRLVTQAYDWQEEMLSIWHWRRTPSGTSFEAAGSLKSAIPPAPGNGTVRLQTDSHVSRSALSIPQPAAIEGGSPAQPRPCGGSRSLERLRGEAVE